MIERIPQLPMWCLPDTRPAFHDVESMTVQQQTAKLYGSMRTFIDDYNNFATEINKTISDFMNSTNQNQDEFEEHINKIVHDYIIMIDTKIDLQDKEIEDSIVFIKDNISEGISNVLNELVANGELDEIVINAFDGLSDRVGTIEKNLLSVDSRVATIENSKVKMIYDSKTESITFENVL